jgi:hypothetical protein
MATYQISKQRPLSAVSKGIDRADTQADDDILDQKHPTRVIRSGCT